MNILYRMWKKINHISEKGMKGNYLKPNGGCDSCCPKCKKWESMGNNITTKPLENGSDERVCANCGNVWIAIFTPAGFIPVQSAKDTQWKR